jgi:hypothetical protein
MQPAVPVDFLAVAIATIATIVLGTLWYGPLFGNTWMKHMGISKPKDMTPAMKTMMMKSYGIQTVASLIMVFVMAHSLVFASDYLGITGVMAGVQAGFWNWLGFVVPTSLGSVLWEQKSWTLWFINAGYYLVTLIVVGVILAIM